MKESEVRKIRWWITLFPNIRKRAEKDWTPNLWLLEWHREDLDCILLASSLLVFFSKLIDPSHQNPSPTKGFEKMTRREDNWDVLLCSPSGRNMPPESYILHCGLLSMLFGLIEPQHQFNVVLFQLNRKPKNKLRERGLIGEGGLGLCLKWNPIPT